MEEVSEFRWEGPEHYSKKLAELTDGYYRSRRTTEYAELNLRGEWESFRQDLIKEMTLFFNQLIEMGMPDWQAHEQVTLNFLSEEETDEHDHEH